MKLFMNTASVIYNFKTDELPYVSDLGYSFKKACFVCEILIRDCLNPAKYVLPLHPPTQKRMGDLGVFTTIELHSLSLLWLT